MLTTLIHTQKQTHTRPTPPTSIRRSTPTLYQTVHSSMNQTVQYQMYPM